jgi:hypothetical protein
MDIFVCNPVCAGQIIFLATVALLYGVLFIWVAYRRFDKRDKQIKLLLDKKIDLRATLVDEEQYNEALSSLQNRRFGWFILFMAIGIFSGYLVLTLINQFTCLLSA